MHWVIQTNLINPATRDELLRVLAARNCSVVLAKLVPVFEVLMEDIEVPAGPVFAYGSTGIGAVSKSHGWAPGYYDAQLDYALMLERYGELALNHGAVYCTLEALPRQPGPFFLRPVLDTKALAGTIMESWAEFEEFRTGIARITDDPEAKMRLTDMVIAAPLKAIEAEYRFFVIGGRVVTGCRYMHGDLVRSSTIVPEEITQFAQQCSNIWAPNDAFAIDIAVTPDGLRVIELNSANAAGFYACDMGRIVDAVEAMLAPA